MRAEGVELIADLETLAVMGFVEVLPRIPYFRRLERRVLALIDERRPALVVLVDYPGFNMRIARAAHARGCRVLYYIAPQVWAWKRGRARKLAETTHGIATILPFEAELLRGYGANAEYVGHPLLDRPDEVPDRDVCFSSWGLDPDRPLVGLFPGSRRQELEHHLALFAEVGDQLVAREPSMQVAISRAETMDDASFAHLDMPVVSETRALQRWSDAALVKSGTSTLETALERTPFVIAYRTSPVTAFVARRVMQIDHIGLPNLVADERVVPELLQEQATPDAIVPMLLDLSRPGSAAREAQLHALDRVATRLGDPGASGRVAEMALSLMDGGS